LDQKGHECGDGGDGPDLGQIQGEFFSQQRQKGSGKGQVKIACKMNQKNGEYDFFIDGVDRNLLLKKNKADPYHFSSRR
jgi:hypothetical protein